MRQFFRFEPAPNIGELTAYFGDYSIPAPTGKELEVYKMPAKRNDMLAFIIPAIDPENVDNSTLSIGICFGEEIVYENVGTIEPNAEEEQLFITVNIPTDALNGCYRFFIYGQGNAEPWVETGNFTCIFDGNGQRTGYADVEESHESGVSNFVYSWSNVFEVGDNFDTKLLNYKNYRSAYGFDYTSMPDFEQQARLHLYIAKADRPVEESLYVQTNGVRRYGKVDIYKKNELATGYFDEQTFDALLVALKHSQVSINSVQYSSEGGFSYENPVDKTNIDGFYELDTATIAIFEQGYNETNDRCSLSAIASGACESYAKFVERQSIGFTQPSENVFLGETGRFVSLVIEIQPAVENPVFTYSGTLPTGTTLFKVPKGFVVQGTPTTIQDVEIVVKSITNENVCGTAVIAFSIANNNDMVDYSPDDYTSFDYN